VYGLLCRLLIPALRHTLRAMFPPMSSPEARQRQSELVARNAAWR
jgi:hypothetical protein